MAVVGEGHNFRSEDIHACRATRNRTQLKSMAAFMGTHHRKLPLDAG
jgi:hypothetical protein